MPLLGAHMSIAGGYYKAVDSAAELGMDVVQIFTKNNNQWRGKPLADEDVRKFRDALERRSIRSPLSHSSYLINLASPDESLWRKSIDALVDELQRAALLTIPFVVLHPGAHTTSSMEEGIRRVAAALDVVHRELPRCASQVLLENTAGQGTCIGWQFEQLAEIRRLVAEPERLGVCLDTCHLFAAGYKLAERSDYLATLRAFDRCLGLDCLQAIHVNDSKRELGSRVDRHEHIGQGHLGCEPFEHLLNDRRVRRVPMYLETPKGIRESDGRAWDQVNLELLRRLSAENRRSRPPRP